MVYKIKFFIFIFLLCSLNTFGKVVYNNQNTIITSIDLQIYQKFYKNNYGDKINNNNALKDLVLIKNLIGHLEKNNKEFLDRIDTEISIQYGNQSFKDLNIRDFLRFSKVRDEFIVNYFKNNLVIEEIEKVFEDLESLNLPISSNECLIIEQVVNLKENKLFIRDFVNNLRNNTRNFKVLINGSEKRVCIDEVNFRYIEQLIVNYIHSETEEEFKYFVYGKTKN